MHCEIYFQHRLQHQTATLVLLRDALSFGVIIPYDYVINIMLARWEGKNTVSLRAFRTFPIFAFLEEANNSIETNADIIRPN